MLRVKGRAVTLAAAVAMAMAWPVNAEESGGNGIRSEEARQSREAPNIAASAGLDQIIVTSQRREENLQRVPIAVTAITDMGLEANGVESAQDLQVAVPGLVYTQTALYGAPYLRGIGSDLFDPNSDPSVATYVDGVFVAGSTASLQNLLGIERIEVLKGPQGTLYGRNAVGGAINIYTLTPSEELEARATATYGNYNRTEVSGFVSGGVSDKLALGIYAAFTRRQTYMDFYTPIPNNPFDHEQNWGLRGKAVWTPSDDLKVTVSAEHMDLRGYEADALRNIQENAPIWGLGTPQIIQRYLVDTNEPSGYHSKQTGLSLRADWDLGWASLVSLSAFRNLNAPTSNDIDGSSGPFLYTDNVVKSRQFSQEIQLLSPNDSKIDWIVGLFYFNAKSQFDPTVILSRAGFLGPGVGSSVVIGRVDLDSFAAFGQMTAPISMIDDDLRITIGARYTVDHKDQEGTAYFSAMDSPRMGYPPIPGTVINYPPRKKTWNRFTPKITLDYSIDDTMFYATFSKGFKAGVYNLGTPADPGPVNPETLTAYEVGVKSQFADSRIRLNAAAYYYDFADIQVSTVDEELRANVQNAAATEVYGAELELTAVVTDNLTLTGSVAWSHGTYKSFPDAPGNILSPTGNTPISVDAAGNRTQRNPEWIFSLGATYSYPLANGGVVTATANWYYNDGFYWDAANQFKQKSYHLVNATMGYTFPDGRFTVTAFVRNLTNSYRSNALLVLPLAVTYTDAEPRMYGLTVDYKF